VNRPPNQRETGLEPSNEGRFMGSVTGSSPVPPIADPNPGLLRMPRSF
jgi:hypothetical protein